MNDVFSAAGVPFDVPSAYAIVRATRGPLFSYATVLDNRSQDPVLVTGKALTSAGPCDESASQERAGRSRQQASRQRS